MERKKALATAASVSAIALAATIALGANVGLFGLTATDNGPGSFQLVDSKTNKPVVRTEIVDIPVPTPDSGGSTSGSTSDSTSNPRTPSVSQDGTSAPSAVGTTPHADDDHESEDDSHGSEPEHDEDD